MPEGQLLRCLFKIWLWIISHFPRRHSLHRTAASCITEAISHWPYSGGKHICPMLHCFLHPFQMGCSAVEVPLQNFWSFDTCQLWNRRVETMQEILCHHIQYKYNFAQSNACDMNLFRFTVNIIWWYYITKHFKTNIQTHTAEIEPTVSLIVTDTLHQWHPIFKNM